MHLRHDLVRLGFSHHYLLNSILSLTALQLYSQDHSQYKWYARAVAHNQAAITRARPHLHSLDDQTQHQALLGFSAFTSMYAVAEPPLRTACVRSVQAQFDPIEELLRALQFNRSTTLFVRQNFSPLIISESYLIKPGGNQREALQDLETRFPQVAPLRECIERLCEGGQRTACLHAVEELFSRLAKLLDNPEDPASAKVTWGWGIEVEQIFLDMCWARHAVALVILAHFTVLLAFVKRIWCMRIWPGVLLGHIKQVLGDEWEDPLKWASVSPSGWQHWYKGRRLAAA